MAVDPRVGADFDEDIAEKDRLSVRSFRQLVVASTLQ
jgi:hypothetical protein